MHFHFGAHIVDHFSWQSFRRVVGTRLIRNRPKETSNNSLEAVPSSRRAGSAHSSTTGLWKRIPLLRLRDFPLGIWKPKAGTTVMPSASPTAWKMMNGFPPRGCQDSLLFSVFICKPHPQSYPSITCSWKPSLHPLARCLPFGAHRGSHLPSRPCTELKCLWSTARAGPSSSTSKARAWPLLTLSRPPCRVSLSTGDTEHGLLRRELLVVSCLPNTDNGWTPYRQSDRSRGPKAVNSGISDFRFAGSL